MLPYYEILTKTMIFKFSLDQYEEVLEITANKKEHNVIKTAFIF